jgi:hypothetical protein
VRRLAIAFFASSLALGCAARPRAVSTPQPRWTAADAARLDERIAELEERLLAHQARVSFWQEMRERHESVTAIACQNLAEHAVAIRAGEARSKASVADQRRRRVASASALPE